MIAKIKKIFQCNKGFSLMEVLIAIVIMSIVSIGVFSLITASSSTFERTDAEIGLQQEAQLALANIQERAIDCDGSVDWDSETNTLSLTYVTENDLSDPDDDVFTTHFYTYNSTDEIIYYRTSLDATNNKLVEDVTSFEVILASPVKGDIPSITIELEMEKRGIVHTTQRVVSFRNAVSDPTPVEGP